MRPRLSDSNVQLRCMEHSLHVAAKHFVQTIAPHFSKKLGTSGNEGNPTSANDSEDPASDNDDEDEDEDIDSGDSLRKAIALVKQVSFSLALIDTFSVPMHKLDL